MHFWERIDQVLAFKKANPVTLALLGILYA